MWGQTNYYPDDPFQLAGINGDWVIDLNIFYSFKKIDFENNKTKDLTENGMSDSNRHENKW